jgi:phosphoribosylformylglycinamidine synthase
MDLATTAMKSLKKRGLLNDLDESEEINACSILIDVDVDGQNEEWILQFKNETHNHPTEIEPYGGASTCLGGAIRDPLAGRAYVYQAMRVTGSGDPTVPFGETLPGKLAQKTITTLAAKGYSDYGNQIGLASGHGAEIYHEGYRAKRMELGAVVGAVKRDHVRRLSPQGGDVVLLVGGRTGRDGCGGATGSSVGHTEASQAQGGAEVQKGNPLIERNLQRLFRSPEAAKRIKRCNDFGAGGISVAVGELADGLDIRLDAVPTKYDGLNGTELAISESQERMAVVVSPEDVSAFTALASAENLECTPIAVVNDSGRMTMRYKGDVVVDIARSFLNSSGAKRGIKVNVTSYVDRAAYKDWQDWLLHLKQLNVACQKGLAERFDATVGAGTVLVPFVGKHRLTPSQVMAAKIPVDGETETASLMAYGFDPYLSENSPFHGAVSAIVESVAKIVAVGGAYPQARLSLQEYFERLDDDPHRWQKPFLALLGAFWVQMALELPAIGGKDSMSGSFEATDPNGVVRRVDVPPTLVSFCVQTAKTPGLISQDLKSTDSHLVYLHAKYDGYHLPDFKYLKSSFNRVTQLIKSGHIKAAYALDAGGLASALTKMALGNGIGACVSGNNWFSADAGSFLLEMTDKPTALLAGLEYEVLGKTVSDPALTVNEKRIPLADCHDAWLSTLEPIFPTGLLKPKPETVTVIPFYTRKQMGTPGFGIAKPRVFMPLFSGTNAEYETTRAFEKKGGQVEAYVIRSLRAEALNESLIHMEKQLGQAQILMLCGGFSAGDEPDGSGKYMATLLTKPRILQAIQELLRRDGLVLGIGNGFQALVRSGFLTSFSLTQNSIGRHVSDLVMTKIISSHSPWLWNTQPGDVHLLPVSHGQGRFMAGDEEMKNMINSGLIAAQYVDFAGQPSMDIRFNPSGSMYAVEAVASPDGRILGKLAHSERVGDGLYKGFDMNMEQGIFAAGVGYYR